LLASIVRCRSREPLGSSGTRERIIDELATWMPKKGTLDAAFLSRNGPPGLASWPPPGVSSAGSTRR